MLKKWFQKLKTSEIDTEKQSQLKYEPLSKSTLKKYSAYRENNPHQLFCYVPFNSMSFSFKGRALACVYNQKVELGSYPQNTIKQMWFESSMGKELKEHLLHNDLNFGCKHCKYFVEHEKFSGLKPLVFDKYKDFQPNQFPKVMEFELSSTCNFECVMCNGYVSSSIRKNRDKLPAIKHVYDDNFVEQLKEFIPHLEEAKFYGGEPFLIPIYFKIWEEIVRTKPSIKIFAITNGSVLDDRIKTILEKGDFDIGVSLDSINKEKLKNIRVNAEYETLMSNIDYFNQYCKSRNKKLVISFTMMRVNYMDFYNVIQFCNKIDATLYVSYLKTPPQFGIWNLPSETLEKIRSEALKQDLPEQTYTEKYNKKIHHDFINYLKNAALDNLTRSKEDIIPLGNDTLPSKIIKVEDFDKNKDYNSLLKARFESNIEVIEKVEKSLNNEFSSEEANKIYYKMWTTPYENLKEDILKLSEDEILFEIKNILNKQTII